MSLRRARGLIAAAVLIAFCPVLLANFSGWDDAMNVTGNAALHPPTLHAVAGFWRGPMFHMYAPLTYTVWAAVVTIFSDQSALPFHAANLLAHGIATLAVFEALRAINARVSTACLAALVFGLHPLAVEPVAWVTGLRDTPAEMFGFVALALYLQPRGGRATYAMSIALLLAGLASKPSIAVLPAIAVLIDLAMQRRSVVACLIRALPWLMAATVCVIIGRSVQGGSQLAPIPHASDRLHRSACRCFVSERLNPGDLAKHFGRSIVRWRRLTRRGPWKSFLQSRSFRSSARALSLRTCLPARWRGRGFRER